jgi:steroid delta-isomerase-like uncharacterized protein
MEAAKRMLATVEEKLKGLSMGPQQTRNRSPLVTKVENLMVGFLNEQDPSVLSNIVDPHCGILDYSLEGFKPPEYIGPDGGERFFRPLFDAFPDLFFGWEAFSAEESHVFVEWVATGTHHSEWLGLPATGKEVRIKGSMLFSFGANELINHWHICWDLLSTMRKLGYVEKTSIMKTLAMRVISEVYSEGKFYVMADLFHPSVILKDPATPGFSYCYGIEDIKKHVMLYRNAFPDMEMEALETLSARNKVIIRWKMTGTHHGVFGDIPATEKAINRQGMAVLTFTGGKVAHMHLQWDALGLLKQIGHAPTQTTSGVSAQ